jgi:hypothetical protein
VVAAACSAAALPGAAPPRPPAFHFMLALRGGGAPYGAPPRSPLPLLGRSGPLCPVASGWPSILALFLCSFGGLPRPAACGPAGQWCYATASPRPAFTPALSPFPCPPPPADRSRPNCSGGRFLQHVYYTRPLLHRTAS